MLSRTCALCGLLVCVPVVFAQPPPGDRGETAAIIVSVVALEITGDAPEWLTPGGSRQTEGRERLRRLWDAPGALLERLRKEAPKTQVRLKFFCSVLTLPNRETHVGSRREVLAGTEVRQVGDALEVVAQPGAPGQVGLSLKLEMSEVTGEAPHPEVEGATIPMISSREMSSDVVLTDDGVALVGGSTNQSRTDDGEGPLVHTLVLVHAKLVE